MMIIGVGSRLHTFSHWLMNSIGMSKITAVGSRLLQMEKKSKEEQSILYKMGYYFVAIYTRLLICICSQLIQLYVYLVFFAM
jgi:hypothetical protein